MQRTRNIFQRSSSPHQSEPYIQLNVSKLNFELVNHSLKNIICRSLFITNTSSTPIRFKIKSTTPFHYIVKPYEGTIYPRENINISVKMILQNRNTFEFNLDRFEILAQPIDGESDFSNKRFWQKAQSFKLSVELIQTYNKVLDYQTVEYRSIKQDKEPHQNEDFNVNQQRVQQLKVQVNTLKEKVDSLRKNSYRSGLLTTKNLIITGLVSFIVGILFS